MDMVIIPMTTNMIIPMSMLNPVVITNTVAGHHSGTFTIVPIEMNVPGEIATTRSNYSPRCLNPAFFACTHLLL